MTIISFLILLEESQTYSHEYEWDTYYDATIEIEVEVIHKYAYQLEEG